MANAINPTTHLFSTPYITSTEYRNAPTSIDIDNLVFNSIDPDAQENELTNVIARASSWIDTFCNQVLSATQETENQRTRISSDGYIKFHPRYNPVIALTAFSYGYPSTNMIVVSDVSSAWVEDQQILFPYANSAYSSSQGPLQFGYPTGSGGQVYIKYTYVTGYVNSLINTAVATQSTLTVTNADGIIAGLEMKIYDGIYSENVTVASTYTFGSTTVPLVSPLIYTHTAGVSISALPPAVKQAAILVTTAFLKVRGDNSLVMGVGTQPSQAVEGSQKLGTEIAVAQQLLMPYRRIR